MDGFNGRFRFATSADAAQIAALVDRCYGDTYVSPTYRDPAVVARAIDDGAVMFAVAVNAENTIVAQVGLARTGNHGLYEVGRSSIVDLPYRALGLAKKLGRMLVEVSAPERGARFLWGRCVTSHLFAQGQARSDGLTPVGLLLGLCPRTFTANGLAAPSQPVSTLVVVKTMKRDTRTRLLRLEGRDLERARATLDALEVRTAPAGPRRSRVTLGAAVERDPGTGLAHVRYTYEEPALDLDRSFVEQLEESGARLVWVDVPAEASAAPELVESLRSVGFSFGCYLPLAGPAGEDVLRLQLYLDPYPLALEEIRVHPEAQALRDEIFAEARVREVVLS